MNNFQVYKKTLPFSFINFAIGLLSLFLVAGFMSVGFFIFNNINSMGILGLFIGLIVAIPAVILVDIFLANRFKAAQISMMTKGVLGEELPDDIVKSGLNDLKGRFGRITAFYFISRAIKGIFNQLGRAMTHIGSAVGGEVGGTVTSVIDTGVQILIGYLVDCCMGWILYRKDINGAKAGCEGAYIFFRHGKTLIRNIGRIFGMGFLSLIVIGGIFFGVTFAILSALPNMSQMLVNEIQEMAVRLEIELPSFFSNPTALIAVIAAVIGIVMFSIIHSVLIRPFILTGVLRNFMEAGKAHIPTEEQLKELDAKSSKFAKLHNSI